MRYIKAEREMCPSSCMGGSITVKQPRNVWRWMEGESEDAAFAVGQRRPAVTGKHDGRADGATMRS